MASACPHLECRHAQAALKCILGDMLLSTSAGKEKAGTCAPALF